MMKEDFMRSQKTLLAGILLILPFPVLAQSLADAERTLVSRISADSLRGHLSFLASDLLEGRATPSRGLDIAAEYIAAQFRRAGLQPPVNGSYFQTAEWELVDPDMDGFEMSVESGQSKTAIEKGNARPQTYEAMKLAAVPIYKLDPANAGSWTAEQVKGKVVVLAPGTTSDRRGAFRAMMQARRALTRLAPALVLTTFAGRPNRLQNPEEPMVATIAVLDPAFRKMIDEWKPGATGAALTLNLKAPHKEKAELRNVVGLLPGSDPVLKDTCVLISSHYDHLGMKANGDGDRIYNGANDDGSGTVSVIEIASALARMPQRPKRSIVFIAYFGEELGLFGSRYYGKHPVFPVAKTVANLNLEQLGRTDAPKGSTEGRASVTGYSYSDVGNVLRQAGEATGVKIENEPESDQYFGRSDNRALADLGVPAHTISAAYVYPDYHGLADSWDKIDYDNMALLDRAVAVAALRIANQAKGPAWSDANPAADAYRKAAETLNVP